MKIIPRNKLDRWVLPTEPKYRKKQRPSRRWRVEAKYIGTKRLFPWNNNIFYKRYITEDDAQKAIERMQKDAHWKDYVFKIKKLRF